MVKNPNTQHEDLVSALNDIRARTGSASNEPSEAVVKLGLLPYITKLLDNSTGILIPIYEIISNIASTTYDNTLSLIKEKIHLKLIKALMQSTNPETQDQILWGLCNIAGSGIEGRNELLKAGLVPQLIRMLSQVSIKSGLLQRLAWAMANLCKWSPPAPFNEIRAFIPYMNMILRTSDTPAITQSLWGLAYITNRRTENMKQLTEFISLATVVELVTHKDVEVAGPALKIIGNVCTGDESDVELVLASNGAAALAYIIIQGNHPCLIREACWVLSNVATGPRHHIEEILGFFPILSELAVKSSNTKVFFLII